MYSIARHPGTPHPQDPLERELREIEELCERALAHPALLRCSAVGSSIVRAEVPRLLERIRERDHLQDGALDPGHVRSDIDELLRALREACDIVRDLVERS